MKNCFAYCALFPKDYAFEKEELIDLWLAQGFIIPPNSESQSLEEVAEEYFLVFLQRGFFQDVERDEWETIKSCKMHDLMHDLAQEVAGVKCEVAGVKCKVVRSEVSKFNSDIHHLSFDYSLTSRWNIPNSMLNLKFLRSFLLPEQRYDGSTFSKSICKHLLSSYKCLRVLHLRELGVRKLPNSIGSLIHLRYLDLSVTPIEKLPNFITELYNLQILNLHYCSRLKILPENMNRLVNLRSCDVSKCGKLKHMPSGLGELTSLCKLPQFTVNCRHSLRFCYNPAMLSDLMNLNNLRYTLHIEILGDMEDPITEATKANLSYKQSLTELHITMDEELYDHDVNGNGSIHDEAVLEGLKPHPNLKKLKIYYYRGQKLPRWAITDNLCINLPNLVEIELQFCGRCEQVPRFSQLRFLKRLSLQFVESVEYMERNLYKIFSSPKAPMTDTVFFPSLQELTLMEMGNLKGWWTEVSQATVNDDEESCQLMQQCLPSKPFATLSKLEIEECPNLKSLPQCPNVELLTLIETNEDLSVLKMATKPSSSPSASSNSGSKLKKLRIDNVEDLISLPKECLHQLSSLEIEDKKLQNTSRLEQVFKNLSSLHDLSFSGCQRLISISKGFEHLTSLKDLKLYICRDLELLSNAEPKEDDGMPWKSLTSLRYLELSSIPKLVGLPSGLQNLINLRSLELYSNKELMELPEWISCFQSLQHMHLMYCPKLRSLPEGFCRLTALNELHIIGCPGLTKRCRGPDGSDWPKIRHIPWVSVLENVDD